MLELEVARERILALIQPLPLETIPVGTAVGRASGERIQAPLDLPIFDNSAMDGYALRAADVQAARKELPTRLKLCGQTAAGQSYPAAVQPGTCVRVFTGSVLPSGADAVVMQEDTRVEAPNTILILESVKPWENIRLRGEDVKHDTEVVKPGERLTAGSVGLLAALGVKDIRAGRKPVIALLATGNELQEAGQPLAEGKIYESNRLTLGALLARSGAVPRILPLLPDDLNATVQALEQALAECDGVVTTGGVSVGEFDLVKKAFEQVGGQIDFWKVAVKPGKPFAFGQRRQKLLFGLPGNPVSAFVTFLLLVRPALLRWQGAANVAGPGHPGFLAEALVNRGERRHFMRVHVDEQGKVRLAGAQASHILGSLAKANGLVDVPPCRTLEAGTLVQVLRWED
jgi:molybdopterin molybdotransferase